MAPMRNSPAMQETLSASPTGGLIEPEVMFLFLKGYRLLTPNLFCLWLPDPSPYTLLHSPSLSFKCFQSL